MTDRIYVYDDENEIVGRQILQGMEDVEGRAAMEPDKYTAYVPEAEVQQLREALFDWLHGPLDVSNRIALQRRTEALLNGTPRTLRALGGEGG